MDGVTFQRQPDTAPIIIMCRIKYFQFAKFFMFESSSYKFETAATRPDKPTEGGWKFSKDNMLMPREVRREARPLNNHEVGLQLLCCSSLQFVAVELLLLLCSWWKGRLCRSASLAVKFPLKAQVYCWLHFTSCVVKGHDRQDEHSSVNSRRVGEPALRESIPSDSAAVLPLCWPQPPCKSLLIKPE